MLSEQAIGFILRNKAFFPNKKTDYLVSRLIESNGLDAELIFGIKLINPRKIILLSIFLGLFGVDRFLIGDNVMGFIKLFSLGGLGLLSIFDCFYISKRVKEINYLKLLGLCYYYKHIF